MDNKNITPVNSHTTMGVTQEQYADAQNHFAAYMREIGRDKFHPDDISNKAGMWFTYTRDTIHPGKPPEPVKFAPAAREQPTIYDTFKTQTKEQQDFTDYMREISQDKFHPDDISNKARIWDIYSRSTIHPEKTIDTVSKQPTIYDTFKPQTREQLQTPYANTAEQNKITGGISADVLRKRANALMKEKMSAAGAPTQDRIKELDKYHRISDYKEDKQKLIPEFSTARKNILEEKLANASTDEQKQDLQSKINSIDEHQSQEQASFNYVFDALIGSRLTSGIVKTGAATFGSMGFKEGFKSLAGGFRNVVRDTANSKLARIGLAGMGAGYGADQAGVSNPITDVAKNVGTSLFTFGAAGSAFSRLMGYNTKLGLSKTNNEFLNIFGYEGAKGVVDSASNLKQTASDYLEGKTTGSEAILKAIPQTVDLGISSLMALSPLHAAKPVEPNLIKSDGPATPITPSEQAKIDKKLKIVTEYYEKFGKRFRKSKNSESTPTTKPVPEVKPVENTPISETAKPVETVPTTEPALETVKPVEPAETTPTTETVSEVKPVETAPISETAKPVDTAREVREFENNNKIENENNATEPTEEVKNQNENAEKSARDEQIRNETRTADEVREFEKDNEINKDTEKTEEVKDQDKSAEDAARKEKERKEREERERKEKEEKERKEKEEREKREKEKKEDKKEEKKEDKKEEDKKEENKKEEKPEKPEEKLTAKQKATAAALGALGSLFGGNGDSRGGLAQGFSNSLGHGLPEQSAPSYERTQTNLHFISEMGM